VSITISAYPRSPFNYTEGSLESGLPCGTPKFFSINGGNWIYTPLISGESGVYPVIMESHKSVMDQLF